MKRSPNYLLVAYFIWLVLSLFVPATTGTYWPLYVPLIVIALLFLILEEKRSRRIIGALLVALAISVIITDLHQRGKLRDRIWKVQIENLKRAAEQGGPGYPPQGVGSPDP